jgi:hypothetical protein
MFAEQSAPLPPLVPPELLVVLPDDDVVLPEDDVVLPDEAPEDDAPDEDAPDEELPDEPDELVLPEDPLLLVLDSPLLDEFVPVSSLEHAAMTAAHEMSPTQANAAIEFLADVMARNLRKPRAYRSGPFTRVTRVLHPAARPSI